MKALTIVSSAVLLITLLENLIYGEAIPTILTINMFLCPILAIITLSTSKGEKEK